MGNFYNFLDLSEFDKRIVIDSEYCMSYNCERLNTSFVELDFSSSFRSVALMIAIWKENY